MRELSLKKKSMFFIKVIAAHVITYFVCGLIAFNLFHYGDFVELIGFKPMDQISLWALLFGQLVRGMLFGFAILWISDSVIGQRLGWLRLWGVLVVLGVFNTYGPNMGSIEGMIYLDMSSFEGVPVNSMLSLLEVTMQPLLFSLIVTYQGKKKRDEPE